MGQKNSRKSVVSRQIDLVSNLKYLANRYCFKIERMAKESS